MAPGDKFTEAALDVVLTSTETPQEPPTAPSLDTPWRTPESPLTAEERDELIRLRVAVDELTAQRDAFGHKAHQLAGELRLEIQIRNDLRTKLAVVNTPYPNVWVWQGDGHDEIESLSCPVVMSADTLRALLTKERT